MGTAVVVFLAVLLGLVLLLAVPLDVAFRLERVEAFSADVAVGWLFGLVQFRVRLPGADEPARRAARTGTKPEKRGGRSPVLAVLRQSAFRQRVYRLVRDLLCASHPRDLRLRMRLGLGDPADTGRLWALIGPLGLLAQSLRHAEVRIEPEFVDPVLEFEAQGRLLLIPLQYLTLAIGFALSPAAIRAWRTLGRSHA